MLDMLACPYCGNNKGNYPYSTIRTDNKIKFDRKCKKCKRRYATWETKIDPDVILDEIKCKVDDLRGQINAKPK